MSILNKNDLPKWQQVKYDIEIKIITGEYEPGERVPSVRRLAELYNIGTSTSQGVLEKMSQEGTIIMSQGIGYNVNGAAVERLKTEHKERLVKIFEQACEDAFAIQVDPMEIVEEICRKQKNN